MNTRALRGPVVGVLMLLVAGCGEQRLQKAQARLESLRKERAEKEAREVEPLRKQLAALRARIDSQERAQADAEYELRALQKQLVAVWHGRDEELQTLVSTVGLPEELHPALQRAQEAQGEEIRQREKAIQKLHEEANSPEAQALRFTSAVNANDMNAVGRELSEWDPGPKEPAEEEPEEAPACENKREGKARCEVLTGKAGTGPSVVLCQIEAVEQWWVASLDGPRVWVTQLDPAPQGRPQWVRALSPRAVLLEEQSAKPVRALSAHGASVKSRRWLQAYGLAGDAVAQRLSLAMDGIQGPGKGAAELLYADLDRDGTDEALWLAGEELRAITSGAEGKVWLLSQAQTCEWLMGRTEEPLQPALRACEAAAKRAEATDGGVPDGGVRGEGSRDAGVRDAGGRDAGARDAGRPRR